MAITIFSQPCLRAACIAMLTVSVAACTFIEEGEVPLEGKRIPVLLHERSVNVDPSLQGAQILLPAPVANRDWPQAGGYPNHAMHHLALADAPTRLWKSNIGTGANDEQRFTSTPVVARGVLYAMDVDHELSAYHADDGKRLWSVELGNETDGDDEHLTGGIAVYRDQVFVTTGFGEVIAVNAADGQIVWRENLRSPLRAAPSLRASRVFVVTLDSRVVALDTINGETLWTYEGVGEGASVLGAASPAIDANLVIPG